MEQDFRNKAEEVHQRWQNRWEQRAQRRRGGRVWTGLFLLAIGALLIAQRAGVIFPSWFISWPMLLIALGIWIGARHRFRGFAWFIPIVIGGLNLLGQFEDMRYMRPYIGPAILILIGLVFIFKPRRHRFPEEGARPFDSGPAADTAVTAVDHTEGTIDRSDKLDITAVFGGVKKNVLSKSFRGGEIVTFMGGAEIDLSQADFSKPIRIECSNVFGGTKLIIPPDWEVQSDIVCVFGGVDDKRPPVPHPAAGKVLYLDGACVFGGVDIRSF
ncbi:MAG: hypothetical protein EOO15_07255 [Chitinophagaceae bacterium]|nr:MAG: hypothetical protein EOO15_07255 [Chitinophagaceae bacterium]